MRVSRALRAIAPYLAALITLLWIGNFIWVLGANAVYGGGALNGFVRDGHYYVGEHGSYTEVGQAIWERIRLHELGLWLGVPVFIASFGYLLFGSVFPAIIGLRHGGVVAERIQSIRTSGIRLASGTCSGNVGGVGYGGPFLFIEVFPGGITVRPFLQHPTAILRAELRGITVSRRRRMYTIVHASPDITSPIVLALSPHSELASTLGRLAQELNPAAPYSSPRTP